ncbi:MAG TPA: hypothetical protein VJC37_02540 [Planctomycetota bacterium]|nr:hypothetical protein [Planctomycetota bacterium]
MTEMNQNQPAEKSCGCCCGTSGTASAECSTSPKSGRWPLYVTVAIGLIIALYYSFGMLMAVTSKHRAKEAGPYQVEFSERGERMLGVPCRLMLQVVSDAKPKSVSLAYYTLNRDEAGPAMIYHKTPIIKTFESKPMVQAGNSGLYSVILPPLMEKAAQYFYYFVLADESGKAYDFKPAGDKNNPGPGNVTYRGEGTHWVTVLHIALMILVVFFMLHVIYYSLAHVARSTYPISRAVRAGWWANIFFFITSYPIGLYVSGVAYGRPWTGVPEVWAWNDADNKSLAISVYWLIILFLIWGVSKGKNKIGTKAYAWLSLIGAIATVYLFLSGGHN